MNTIQNKEKLDLHCHLDGSLSISCIRKLARALHLELHENDEELLYKMRAPRDCRSLAEYLERFDLPLSFLKTRETFQIAAYELMRDAAAEHVSHLEIRFAPFLSVSEELSAADILEGAIAGIQKAEQDFAMKGNIIACLMRHEPVDRNLASLEQIAPYVGKGVCAVDIAGDEAAFPMGTQKELFVEARRRDIPFTIHAGECGDPENIAQAVELGAKRIGHGIAMIKDPDLRTLCRQKRVGIEMCPTSNLQTKAIQGIEEYPITTFLEENLLVSVNTDNRTVSGTTETQELQLMKEHFGISEDLLIQNAKEMIF